MVVEDLNLTLYKDNYVYAGEFSNLYQTNESLRKPVSYTHLTLPTNREV